MSPGEVAQDQVAHAFQNEKGAMRNKSGSVAVIEAIYNTYPRKVCKREALRAIDNAVQRLVKGESGSLMEWRQAECFLASKSKEFANSIAGSRGVFTPYPASWFNKSRYLDDVEEWNREDRQFGSKREAEFEHVKRAIAEGEARLDRANKALE